VPAVTAPGELALVLHSHMPYVEGFGTWPFGEEWLWEAVATSYLPLLGVLERTGAPVTLSVTPVLADQLEAPGALARCLTFLRDVRPESHARDLAAARDPGVRAALHRSAAEYAAAADRLDGLDLLAALRPYARWTSSSTHAILPLLATDAAVRLQLAGGVAAHRRRFGAWGGGLWLPECAYAPWLEPLLEEAGVHATCVDLTDVLGGAGAPGHLRPLRTEAGPVLVPLDRQAVELIWSDHGYPAHPAYRDYHGYTAHRHRAWANDGAPYDSERAGAAARAHAADFVARIGARVAAGGLCVVALDTELLGHWWHEGPAFLSEVIAEAERSGLALTDLDDAVGRHEAADAPPDLPVTTWGTPRDLSTWSGPAVADLAWAARAAELRAVAAPGLDAGAARELLALQASDWPFLLSRDLAGDYPRERFAGHLDRLEERLRGRGGDDAALRNIAPDADPRALA
jgi:1,4-alpha-glucan branching enzyme